MKESLFAMNTIRQIVFTFIILTAAFLSGCVGQNRLLTPTPQPTTTSSGDPTPRITLADNEKTFIYQAGQNFLLFLGEDYNWTLSISDQNVISRVKNIATIRGAQGVFDTLTTGRSVISAVGDPTCRDQKPACERPSIQFQVTIVVQ
jgi:hypothetical protein